MATIHRTTMAPTKLELLAGWLPRQPWWQGGDRPPQLAPAGGFRLDDPAGEVGLEFLVVTDAAGDRPVAYHVPLSYRGAPLAGADAALVGTSEHGVLGRRWVYDGAGDPVLTAALDAFVHGRATAQHRTESDTPEPSVVVRGSAGPAGTVELVRVLGAGPAVAGDATGSVEAGWTLPDGTAARGAVVLLR